MSRKSPAARRRHAPRPSVKLILEVLEDRPAPAGYTLTPLTGLQEGGFPQAVNASGEVIGVTPLQNNSLGGNSHAALFANGKLTDLGTLPGDDYSFVGGINASGDVVGTSVKNTNSGGVARAFLYSNGQMVDLNSIVKNSPGQLVGAAAINGTGEIVGNLSVANGADTHAFLYDPSTGTVTDLGALNSSEGSEATDLNNSEQVVGSAGTPSGDHAFLYTNGRMTDLGTLPGYGASNLHDRSNSLQQRSADRPGKPGRPPE